MQDIKEFSTHAEAPQALAELISTLPSPFPKRLKRLPFKELPELFRNLDAVPQTLAENPEDEDARADFDRALRYLESKTQLVRMLLITRIRSDGYDVEDAEDIAAEIISDNFLSDVYTAYDARQETS